MSRLRLGTTLKVLVSMSGTWSLSVPILCFNFSWLAKVSAACLLRNTRKRLRIRTGRRTRRQLRRRRDARPWTGCGSQWACRRSGGWRATTKRTTCSLTSQNKQQDRLTCSYNYPNKQQYKLHASRTIKINSKTADKFFDFSKQTTRHTSSSLTYQHILKQTKVS